MATLMLPVLPTYRHATEKGALSCSVAKRAFEVYAHLHPGQTFERLHERGGFGGGELVAFLYARSFPQAEWRDRVEEAFRGLKI